VLIYFEQATKIDVLNRIARITAPDGYLTLGAAETVIGLTDTFRAVQERRGVYELNRPAAATPASRPTPLRPAVQVA
jgi:chemotaxis protein methyltransferase CheR